VSDQRRSTAMGHWCHSGASQSGNTARNRSAPRAPPSTRFQQPSGPAPVGPGTRSRQGASHGCDSEVQRTPRSCRGEGSPADSCAGDWRFA